MVDISDNAHAVMANWHKAKPVFCLMGEFSAGKSTLVNTILVRELAPTKVTATQLPAMWLTFSEEECLEGLRPDGELTPLKMADLGETVREDFVLLRYGINAELLKETDIIDAPGISDPRLQKGATLFLGPYLDFVFWCSSATQAWRQSEKKNWTNFPPQLRRHSTILLTRKDKLRRASDVSRVVNRVTRDTKDLFADVVAVNTLAIGELKDAEDRDAEAWEHCGGKALFARLDAGVAAAQNRIVTEPEPESPAPEPKATPETKAGRGTAVAKTAEAIAVSASTNFHAAFNAEFEGDRSEYDEDQIKTKLEQLTNKLDSYNEITPTQRFALKQCLNVGSGRQVNLERLLGQIETEIMDFNSDNWCTLSPAA